MSADVVSMRREPILGVIDKNAPKPVNHDAVEMIEDVLARVKSGEITAVGVCCVNFDGGQSTAWAGSGSVLVAAASWLIHRMHTETK